ncbi:MAG: UDP-3-O-(3-hydroxymyristoyl)glucosamine N-acyltransferase [Gammaproteobacteria bacterium]|nr:UDP-3-O-(3-hydroxymyristoyl)glucosamine N-acyltransferase [Gammaproteobacteria bacterium]
MVTHRLGDIARDFDLELRGDENLVISGVGTLASAGPDCIGFLANSKYRSQLGSSRAGAVILAPADAEAFDGNALLSANPYLAFARVAALFEPQRPAGQGVHAAAVVDAQAEVDPSATVMAGAVLARGVSIGAGVVIGANCVLEDGARVGKGTRLAPNVTLCRDVVLGERCIVHPGVVIGADGFGQAPDEGKWVKVPQLGSVVIGNDVEIGANTTIDRGALGDTVIEDGVRLDNQIQIAHNVVVGAHTAIAGCTAVAGSTRIGRHCMIAGKVGITGHLDIADGTTILASTLVARSIGEPGVYSGSYPMERLREWRKNTARVRQLDELAREVRALRKKDSSDKQ